MLHTPGASLKELLVKFSGSGDALAVAEADGRVKTFDTESGRLKANLVGDDGAGTGSSSGQGHLAERFTSLAWVSYAAGKAGGKSKKKSATSTATLLALGDSAGDVKAYDLAHGELKWSAKGCHDGAVTSVCFTSGDGGGLYTAGEDAKVQRLDPATGEVKGTLETGKSPLQAIAVSPDGLRLLAGAGQITLWDLEEGKKLKKFSGHSQGVTCLAFAPGGRWGMSGGAGERQVAVWDCGGKASKKTLGAAGVLSLEDAPVQLGAASLGGGDGSDGDDGFHALAVSDAGEAYVWACGVAEGRVSAGQAGRVRVRGDKAAVAGAAEVVLAAVLETTSGEDEPPQVLLARGSASKPTFERVPAPAAKKVVQLDPVGGGLLLSGGAAGGKDGGGGAKAAAAAARAVEVLGAENAMDPVAVRAGLAADASADGKKSKKKRARGGAEDEDEDMASAGVAGGGGGDGEETLGDKMAALGLLEPSPMDVDAAAGGGGKVGAGAKMADGPIKADSLAVLLQQALQAEDKALLERCLAVGDEGVVGNTVRRLPAAEAATFLRLAVQRLQSRPARGSSLAVWLKALLVHHTAYLMSAPGVQPVLTALYQTIDARVAMLQPLMALSGRLDLLLAQLPKGEADQGAGAGAGADGMGGALYEDRPDDGGVVAVEDALLGGGADDDDSEWETDSDGGGGGSDDDEDGSGEGGSEDGFSDDLDDL